MPYIFRLTCFAFLLMATLCGGREALAQVANTEVKMEATESLGVGLESRFDSGVKPITAERVRIVPGTPLTVKPTMDNLITTQGQHSFGGILGRYDTSNFGKFFDSGSFTPLTNETPTTPASRHDSASMLADSSSGRIYPPRLTFDENEMPLSDGFSPIVQKNIIAQVQNVARQLGFDPTKEKVELVFEGRTLILTGQILSKDHSTTLERVLSMEPGIDRVENRIATADSSELLQMPIR